MFTSTGRNEQGASLVEMALVMGLLLLLIAGAADLGRAMHTWIIIHNAAREGARWGSHFPWDQDGILQATVAEAAGSGVDLSAANITVAGGGSGVQGGTAIQVDIEYQLTTILAGIAGLNSLTLRTSTEMIVFGMDTPGG